MSNPHLQLFLDQQIARLIAALRAVSLWEMDRLLERIETVYRQKRTLFLLGNGGSAATASHLACDLQRVGQGAQRLRVLSLADNTPLLTAAANDLGFSEVFCEPLAGLLDPDDLVLAFTTSGRSPNVLKALGLARACGAGTAALLGGDGGPALALVDVAVTVPDSDPKVVESAHVVLSHVLAADLLARLGSRLHP